MGLTVHFTLKSDCQTPEQAKRLLGKLRQRAFDLPVENVSEIRRLRGVVPEWGDGIEHDPLWFDCVGLVQRGPWAYDVLPKHALAFPGGVRILRQDLRGAKWGGTRGV